MLRLLMVTALQKHLSTGCAAGKVSSLNLKGANSFSPKLPFPVV